VENELDEQLMRRALALAERGAGWTSPNPMVGALVVKGGEVIAEGFHARCGEAHAERIALDRAGEAARGAALYVTLEPCAHQGRTPPCLDRVLESGVARVVVAMQDPNPLTQGRSIQAMRERGIVVQVGVCEPEARRLNHPFLSSILRQRPWVTLKYAMTLDGRIATSTGSSKWVSGEASRRMVQEIRRRQRAVLVGFRTAITDDPLLNCRLDCDPPPRQPLRIVLGGTGSLPRSGHLAKTSGETPVLHVLSARRWRGPIEEPEQVEAVTLGDASGRGSILGDLMLLLHEREIDSLLVEGGAQTLSGFLAEGLADEVYAFIAPKILNDSEALSPFPGRDEHGSMDEAAPLRSVSVREIGGDALVHGFLTEL
jgi:diaminohydroxyphosphoribosylaminopyrimidine deaminase/5-amino-6-(5-phosphoribosylamino)uracil reductase